ncbi:unnamed protein product [Didymodactylos carnosus]|uniref:Uncharacterized protein n=1 Tax=Didymodactylos carnosus TaxID=1234261 RepID=A0A8S2QCX7_9BILA|nr:unnamed protein product [Didymodactylos carnosus]CAF4098146.1 unnamed protein product [Didymodactylos carnosus]
MAVTNGARLEAYEEEETRTCSFSTDGKRPNSNDSENRRYRTPPIINMFTSKVTENSIRNLSRDSIAFIWFQVFIKILLRMEHTNKTTQAMIEKCRSEYETNSTQLQKIDEFQQTYETDQAIWWYTRDSFLFGLVSKSLLTQDIHSIIPFRLFIVDLHNQLGELHYKRTEKILKVYRGKKISISVLQNLIDNQGGLISMNEFLTATADSEIAIMFAGMGVPLDGYESVLFELDLDNDSNDTNIKPFADITHRSQFPQEQEILFSAGTVWRIKSVKYNEDLRLWSIYLKLSGNNELKSVELINQLNKQIDEQCTLLTLGDFLLKIEEYDKAEYYFKEMLNELSSVDKRRGILYNSIGLAKYKKGDPKAALKSFKQAQDFIEANYPNYGNNSNHSSATTTTTSQNDKVILIVLTATYPSEITIYNNIGYMYHKMRDFEKASENYQKALDLYSESGIENVQGLSAIHNNIGGLCFDKGEFNEALRNYREAVNLLPETHA